MTQPTPTLSPAEVRQKNVRLGLTLASIAVVFFLGFVAKMTLLASH